MADRRIHDFKSPDFTLYFNEKYKGIVEPGVYFGYNVIPGALGGFLTVEMESDPILASGDFGTVVTPSGVVVHTFDDDTTSIVVDDNASGFDRVDRVILRYAYTQPATTHSLLILKGVEDGSLIPPAINPEFDTILAEVLVPTGFTGPARDPNTLTIENTQKKNLYAPDIRDELAEYVSPGVLRGYYPTAGTGPGLYSFDVSANGDSVVLTKQGERVRDTTDQVDSASSSGMSNADKIRRDTLVLLKKRQDIENPIPHIFYAIEGVEVDMSVANDNARAPDIDDIATAINLSADPSLEPFQDADPEVVKSYVTILGHALVTGVAPTLLSIDAAPNAEVPASPTIYGDSQVFGTTPEMFDAARNSPYFGLDGLIQWLDDVDAYLSVNIPEGRIFTANLRGVFSVSGPIFVPLSVGLTGPAVFVNVNPNNALSLIHEGFRIIGDDVTVKWTAANPVVVTGGKQWDITISNVADIDGFNLEQRRMPVGLQAVFVDPNATPDDSISGDIVSRLGPLSFQVVIPNTAAADTMIAAGQWSVRAGGLAGATGDLQYLNFVNAVGVGAAQGAVRIGGQSGNNFEGLWVSSRVEQRHLSRCSFDRIDVQRDWVWEPLPNDTAESNQYDEIRVGGGNGPDLDLFLGESNFTVGNLRIGANGIGTNRIYGKFGQFDNISYRAPVDLNINSQCCVYSLLVNDIETNPNIDLVFDDTTIAADQNVVTLACGWDNIIFSALADDNQILSQDATGAVTDNGSGNTAVSAPLTRTGTGTFDGLDGVVIAFDDVGTTTYRVGVQPVASDVVAEVIGAVGPTNFTGNLGLAGVMPGTLTLTDGTLTVTDDGAGNLIGDVDGGGVNTIDYETGAYDVTFNAATTGVNVTADYTIGAQLGHIGDYDVRTKTSSSFTVVNGGYQNQADVASGGPFADAFDWTLVVEE